MLKAVDGQQDHTLNGKRFVTGMLGGKDVLLVLSGVSMVNAAMTAQQVIDRFNVSAIVFSGIAGGVDPSLKIGDVVVADQWGEYLESHSLRHLSLKLGTSPFSMDKGLKTPLMGAALRSSDPDSPLSDNALIHVVLRKGPGSVRSSSHAAVSETRNQRGPGPYRTSSKHGPRPQPGIASPSTFRLCI